MLKEIEISLKSLTFWIVALIIGGFLFSQFSGTPLNEPKPNQENYGSVQATDQETIIAQTMRNLYIQHEENTYDTYPFVFLKEVKLSSGEQAKVKKILEEAIGQPLDSLQFETMIQTEQGYFVESDFKLPIVSSYDYSKFKQDMAKVATIIGRGSDFEENKYAISATKAQTYQGAKAEFDKIKEKDHVVGAYARLISDYLVIILSLAPVFLAATVLVRDQRAMSQDTIFTKKTSTFKLVGTRYLSVVILMTLVASIVAIMPTAQSMFVASKLGVFGNPLIVYAYLAVWLIPSILAVTGISFLITSIFGGIVSVLTAFVIWFTSLNLGATKLDGFAGWNLIPRFNQVGARSAFEAMLPQFINNRMLWSAIGIACFLLSVVVINLKRKGVLRIGKNE